ncbi:glycosyltransferase family 4 protein [Micromonospora zhanjiangensis]|uniref:Glycosyltransferase family 4 protein n=1 Tax=Micromonospora zhanjiangensis TaxID=1522057 RepID=A0ABV8KS81_9ACTN
MRAEAATTDLRRVHVVLPGDIDDPTVPSGGNTYDRRVCQDLPTVGWSVGELTVDGGWPRPDRAAAAALAAALAVLPDGAVVLLDGLVACAVPEVVVPAADRLRLAVLVHLPLADESGLAPDLAARLDAGERRVLRAARAVVATSTWAADRLVDRHGLDPARVHVAAPGVDAALPVAGTCSGGRLVCVASVTRRKGQDLLVEALATVTDLDWDCQLVGGLRRDPDFVDRVRRSIGEAGLDDRIRLTGPRTGDELAATYAAADLTVLPSHAETYGMVVTESLARGVPVLATAVDGVPEALGHTPDGALPGILVPAGDPAALAGAVRRWLSEPELRARLRSAAVRRRTALAGWAATSQRLAGVLDQLRRDPGGHDE